MSNRKQLQKEVMGTLIIAILGFILLSLLSCSTSSQYGCDYLLAEEKDACMENYRNMDNQMRYREFMGAR